VAKSKEFGKQRCSRTHAIRLISSKNLLWDSIGLFCIKQILQKFFQGLKKQNEGIAK
jgi:hypothetical protein